MTSKERYKIARDIVALLEKQGVAVQEINSILEMVVLEVNRSPVLLQKPRDIFPLSSEEC